MTTHRFSREIEEQLRRLGFKRCLEVARTRKFREFLEDNPIPAGHSYVFTFDSGDEFGVDSNSDEPPGKLVLVNFQ